MGTLKVKIFETLFGKKAMFEGIPELLHRHTQARPGNHHPDLQPVLDTMSVKLEFLQKHQDEILASALGLAFNVFLYIFPSYRLNLARYKFFISFFG